MKCACKKTPKISEEAGKLLFSFDNPILVKHLESIFHKSNTAYTIEKSILITEVDNLSKTLHDLVSNHKDFLDAEKEAIKVLPLKQGEEMNFEAFSKTKSLLQISNLFQSGFLLDILDKSALTSHFQPIIDPKNKKIYGYECLVRGVNDDGTLIYPDILFDAAKKTDLIFNLDRQSRETALKTGAVKKIQEHLFINFLPTTIYNPETCLQDTFKWAKTLEYDPSKLVFEVVETEKIDDFDHLAHILSYYKKQGVKTALDDVGAGFSNLNALIKLKPNIIKIDREIIHGVSSDKLKQSVFEALVRIAKENKIIVLAEGLENKEDFLHISKFDIDLIQGYYFGKPNVEPIRSILNL